MNGCGWKGHPRWPGPTPAWHQAETAGEGCSRPGAVRFAWLCRWDFDISLGRPFQCFITLTVKSVFSYVQMGFHISVCAHHLLSPLWAPLTRVCLQLLHSLRSGICIFICIPPEPAFLQAQLAQPLLIGRMLQALNHSVALHQTRTSVCIQPVSKQCEWEGS